MPNDDAGASQPNFVPLRLIWDHNGKRIVDSATGENLTARYGIETIIGTEDGCIALRLAQGLGVEAIDTRYGIDDRDEKPAEILDDRRRDGALALLRKRVLRTFVLSWPCNVIASVGYRLRCLQADFAWNDAEAKFK